MKENWKRAGEIALVLAVIALSVFIFLERDELSRIGNVGYLGLFALCFLCNATVFVPAPSLMIAASCALILDPLLVSLVGALGTSCGELVGYACGNAGTELSPRFRDLLARLSEKVHREALWVFLLALLPLPLFDVAGIWSGGTRMPLARFFGACFLGKLIKMLIYTEAFRAIPFPQIGL